MSDEEVLLRKGALLEDHRKIKDRLALLESDARSEAKVLQQIVRWLESAGQTGTDSVGMPPSHYFSNRLVELIENLKEARQAKMQIEDTLMRMGHHVS